MDNDFSIKHPTAGLADAAQLILDISRIKFKAYEKYLPPQPTPGSSASATRSVLIIPADPNTHGAVTQALEHHMYIDRKEHNQQQQQKSNKVQSDSSTSTVVMTTSESAPNDIDNEAPITKTLFERVKSINFIDVNRTACILHCEDQETAKQILDNFITQRNCRCTYAKEGINTSSSSSCSSSSSNNWASFTRNTNIGTMLIDVTVQPEKTVMFRELPGGLQLNSNPSHLNTAVIARPSTTETWLQHSAKF